MHDRGPEGIRTRGSTRMLESLPRGMGLCSEAPEKGRKHQVPGTLGGFGVHLVGSDDTV